MVEGEGKRERTDHPLEGQAVIEIATGSPHLQSASVFSDSEIQGSQTFSLEQTKLEQKGEAAAHRRLLEQEQLAHELQENEKDNALRRWCIRGILGAILVVLVVSMAMVILGPEEHRDRWMGVATTVIGSLLGAVAGYFAGRSNS